MDGGCRYDDLPNSRALGGGTYAIRDANGNVLSHGSFRIANTACTTEGLDTTLFSSAPWPYSAATCSAATFRQVALNAAFTDADIHTTTAGRIGAGISPTGAWATAELDGTIWAPPQVDPGFLDGVAISC
jgi:hypothetical protein